MNDVPNIVIVEARFYEGISEQLALGALAVMKAYGATVYRIAVPGVLEIPAALKFAIEGAGNPANNRAFDGGVVLGCAIKGETDHYEHVCSESIGGVQAVALSHSFAIGSGILTCPTRASAEVRADPNGKNFGGRAAEACLSLLETQQLLGGKG